MSLLLPITDETTGLEFEDRLVAWIREEITVAEERADIVALLEQAVALGRDDLIELFVQFMDQEVPNSEEMPYLAYVLTLPLSDAVLDLLSETFDPEYYQMLSALCYSVTDEHIAIGISNIKKIYSGVELDKSALELLHEKAIERDSPRLAEYYAAEIERTDMSYAIVPEWIIPSRRSHTDLLFGLHVHLPEPWSSSSGDPEADADYILSLVEEDKDLEDARGRLLAGKFSTLVTADREEMINQLRLQNALLVLSQDPEMFRVLGPCLPPGDAYKLHVHSSDPCNMYGGCRVYTCYENENVVGDTLEAIIDDPVASGRLAELEWFTGRCKNTECQLFIRKKCHALRLPVATEGGWYGCYCSFYCMRQVARDAHDVTLSFLSYFEEQYIRFGVYDRND